MNIRTHLIITVAVAIGAFSASEKQLSAMPAVAPSNLTDGHVKGEAVPEPVRIICYRYGRCYRTYGYRHYYYRHYGYRYYGYPGLRFGLGIF